MNFKKWFFIFAVFGVLCAGAFVLFKPSPPPQVKMPNPNGYDDLLKAGQMLAGDLPECYWEKLDAECLEKTRSFLQANREALELIRLGLSRESRVPIIYDQTYIAGHLDELAVMKRLAQTLAAEGKIAELEGRTDDAIQSYLDAASLGEKMRGGVMIDALVAIATEAIGVNALQKISDTMTQDQRRNVIKAFLELYVNRDSFAETMANEKYYVANVSSLRERLAGIVMHRSLQRTKQKFELKIKFRRARLGLFLVDLAARNFEADKGQPPKTLQELVPDYLPFIPKDDFSGKDFIYRSTTNGYLLYGIGSDEKDDGGIPLTQKGTDSPGDMVPNSQY